MTTGNTPRPAKTRDFTLHDRAIDIWIDHQAGSLAKGILETVMNSVDAGSPTIDITLTPERITVADRGRGFASLETIEAYFSTLGTPHEEGDATYGRFRMGRAQIFRHGVSIWRSNTFRFVVDRRHDPDHHQITHGLPHQPGCTIDLDLYEPLDPRDILQLEETLGRWTCYMPATITINGRQTSIPVESVRWTIITQSAYILLDDSPVFCVFNKGVFVREFTDEEIGTGGIAVSRNALDLIYARNDISHRCQTWMRIQTSIQNHLSKTETETNTPARRALAIRNLIDGKSNIDPLIIEQKIITLGNGRHVSLDELYLIAETIKRRNKIFLISSGDPDHRMTRAATESRTALVISSQTCEHFGLQTAEGLADLLRPIAQRSVLSATSQAAGLGFRHSQHANRVAAIYDTISSAIYRPMDTLMPELPSTSLVPASSLDRNSQAILRIIDSAMKKSSPGSALTTRVFCSDEDSDIGYGPTLCGSILHVPMEFLQPFDSFATVTIMAGILHEAFERASRNSDGEDESPSVNRVGTIFSNLLDEITRRTNRMIKENRTDQLRALLGR